MSKHRLPASPFGWLMAASGCATLLLLVLYACSYTMLPAALHLGSSAGRFDADFSRSDAWNALGGSWDAHTGVIESKSEERGAKLISRLGPWSNMEVQADMLMSDADGESGILLRTSQEEEGVNAYNGYFASIRAMDGMVQISRSDYGLRSLVHAQLHTNAVAGSWLHLRLAAAGCALLFEVTPSTGQPITLATTDAVCLQKGSFGLRSSQSGTLWRNLHLAQATTADPALQAPLPNAMGASTQSTTLLDLALPDDQAPYLAALAVQARKHEILPGVDPISKFALLPGLHHNVRLQGTVISTPPLAAIQDDSSALILPQLNADTHLKRGDVVEAQGDVFTTRFRSQLDNAHIRLLWSDTPIPPLAVTASQLTSGAYRGRTISIEGILVSSEVRDSSYQLILRDRDFLFRAVGKRDFAQNLASFEPGSRLRILGFATSMERFTSNNYPFAVIADHIERLAPAPWWNLQHALAVAMVVVLFLLGIQFALHRLQRWHTNSLLHEREQLAFEMHDTLAQNFTGIAYQLQAASLEKRGESFMRQHVETSLRLVQISHKEASRTIAALRPQHRDAASILAALQESGERLSYGGNLTIRTELSGWNTQLPLRITDALFRIGQEAISNAVQHSGCTALDLKLVLQHRSVDFYVRDNGCGFQPDAVSDGLGLTGMRNRAALIKAQLNLDTVPGQGTTIAVHASFPLSFRLLDIFRSN